MPDDDSILGFAADTTDTTTQHTAQIPADIYSTVQLEALYAARTLTGIVSATQEDLSARAGATVQVPYMGRRTAQGPISEGAALFAHRSDTGTYPITLSKFGDYNLVNRDVFEDQDNFSLDDFARNQAEALAEKVDQLVYDELETATPGGTVDLATAGTLTDIYNKIVDAKTVLNKNKGYKATHVIMGPDQAAQLLKETSEGVRGQMVVVENGEVTKVAGLTAVVTSLANANVATFDEVQAIVIDKSRAVGEAWGRRPTLLVDETSKGETDQVKIITWLRYNAAEMDTTAIVHVTNPGPDGS